MDDSKVLVLSDGTQPNIDLTSDTATENSAKQKNKRNVKNSNDEDSGRNKKQSVKKLMVYRQIRAKIAYYRTLRQMSQRELASKVNLSSSTLGRIERGKYNNGVPISTLLDIAEGLRIELSSLVTFSEEEKKVWWEIDKNML